MTEDEKWDEVRAYFDQVGLGAIEHAVAEGVPAELAGRRVAEFNDTLIASLKAKGVRP